MILVILFIISLISCAVLLLCVDGIINQWYDFYLIILIFLAFYLAYFIIYWLLFALYTLTLSRKKKPSPSRFVDELSKRMCEMVTQVLKVRINIRGKEQLDVNKNYMLVQNHLSMLDPIITIWALKYFDFSFLYKENLLKVPVLGNILNKQGHISLDRSNNRKGLEAIINGAHILEDGKRCVGVYPEGTRSKDGVLADFHAGTFKMAQRTKKPIVISVMINSNYIKKRWLILPTHIYLDIIKVIEYDEYKDMTSEELCAYVHNLMSERIKELELLEYKRR